MKNKNIKVEISKKDLYRTCYWAILKYKHDLNHYQKVGSKTQSIGCYLDGWIHKLPERLILTKLVEKKDYSIVEDNFIYGQDTKKNSPDLIGLKKDEKIIPMALYNNGRWEMVKNAPFIEVKTFKNNQLLVTIPESQFDENKYYIIVKSNLRQDYLLNLFENKFFDECDLDEFETYDEFIKSNEKLIKASKIERPSSIGSYELIGIYKGSQIKKISKTVGKGKYYYLASLREIKSKDKLNIELTNGPYCHSNNEIDCLAFCIQKEDDSEITIKNEGKSYIDVLVKGNVKIDNFKLKDGRYRLNFKIFSKSSETLEVIVPRNTLKSLFKSKYEELLEKIDEFIEKSTKNQSG